MSKKRDPIVAVLEYFETADPIAAQQMLVLAKTILRRRLPLVKHTAKKPAPKPALARSQAVGEV